MKWEEVRNLYPGKFVKFEVVESHTKDGKEYISLSSWWLGGYLSQCDAHATHLGTQPKQHAAKPGRQFVGLGQTNRRGRSVGRRAPPRRTRLGIHRPNSITRQKL